MGKLQRLPNNCLMYLWLSIHPGNEGVSIKAKRQKRTPKYSIKAKSGKRTSKYFIPTKHESVLRYLLLLFKYLKPQPKQFTTSLLIETLSSNVPKQL